MVFEQNIKFYGEVKSKIILRQKIFYGSFLSRKKIGCPFSLGKFEKLSLKQLLKNVQLLSLTKILKIARLHNFFRKFVKCSKHFYYFSYVNKAEICFKAGLLYHHLTPHKPNLARALAKSYQELRSCKYLQVLARWTFQQDKAWDLVSTCKIRQDGFWARSSKISY